MRLILWFNGATQGTLAHQMRIRRLEVLKAIINNRVNLTVLDVGGTASFWKITTGDLMRKHRLRVTILNRSSEPSESGVRFVKGDGRKLQYGDNHYDIVFSNSTIEHVGSLEDQRDFASEIMRVGKAYAVQTPNYWFPIEPHFMLPGFQFLPVNIRAMIHRSGNWGWWDRATSWMEARREVEQIRLISEPELKWMFPGANIYKEKFAGLTKSFIAWKQK